ncbi:response regulator transcription factor [Paenibacillus arenilitoris]|uniref:Response regulator transcription factor n=1 Tax=Paenibacillus arenilitoris TaxID=2772299 RepID=A0A927CUB5_9BACL|nr:response regulator transcription factor [Paenibacillus arenilitoris]MBD2871705.1 response regulator transcription factor [Paenibacillus arenilitoris]
MNKTKILIIEDEPAIADMLEYGLQREGYDTAKAHTGHDGLRLMESWGPDMLLLDWMLPDQSGLDICKQATASYNIPILMITAKSDITDKILGLEFGADDYITKPFDLREVIARIRTILRRVAQANRNAGDSAEKHEPVVRFLDIEIHTEERTVRKSGRLIELTPKEYDVLLMLYNNKGKIFTRAELLDYVWGYDYPGDTRTVDTHIQRLRKKLDAGEWITTVFGIGYKFDKQAGT